MEEGHGVSEREIQVRGASSVIVKKLTLEKRCESRFVAGRIVAPGQPHPHAWDLCSLPSRSIEILQI